MQTTLRLTTRVLPGNRIEITAPELREGEAIDVLLLLSPDSPSEGSVIDFLDALPEGPRRAQSWSEIDAAFEAERDAWDR
jgi:hypothetical protein